MRRRTFLKTTGALTVLGVTGISFAEKEQQWIKMKDKKPKVGQKVIILSYDSYNGSHSVFPILWVTERVKTPDPYKFKGTEYFRSKVIFWYSLGYDKNYRVYYYEKNYNRIKESKIIDKISKAVGKDSNTVLIFNPAPMREKVNEWHWRDVNFHDNMYWLPADKYYSKDLPKLPMPIVDKEQQ